MFDSFDSLPSKVQTWFMYQLLRRCGKPTLHFVADVVNPALKCDFLARLPLELSMNVVRFLDVKTMCRAAQVSRKWREIVNTDENAWRNLLIKDGFTVPKHEMDRARREGWEWQGLENYEKDLSASLRRIGDMTSSSRTGVVSRDGDRHSVSTPVARGTKRKLSSKSGSNKRRKIKHFKKHKQLGTAISLSDGAMVPRVLNPLALTADIPELGLKSLRLPHLYKSVYRRHYGIRRGWMEEGMEPLHLAFRAHGRHVVTCLQFDTDKILTGSDDTRIHVYNTKSGALDNVLNGHEGGVWALQYDGNTLVSGSTDRTVRVWNIQTGECLHVFQGHTSTVRCLVILKPTVVGHRADGSPIMMPKEPLIITGSRDSTLRIWKLPRPGAESVFQTVSQVNEDSNPYFVRTLSGHIHSVRAIAAHGDTLVSGSYDATVRVWKISTGEVAHRLNGHAAKVYSVILDHERNRCISGSMDNLVKVWSLESGVCLFNLEGHTSLVGLLDLGHQRLVSAAADSTLRIWDPETGQCKSTLSAHTGAITCFQHDAQKVISGSDRTLKMWDVKTGECVRDLLTDLSGVWQVKFNERKCVAAVQRNNWTYIEVRASEVIDRGWMTNEETLGP
jgi:F-box and WD-40 domain protein CDC4